MVFHVSNPLLPTNVPFLPFSALFFFHSTYPHLYINLQVQIMLSKNTALAIIQTYMFLKNLATPKTKGRVCVLSP